MDQAPWAALLYQYLMGSYFILSAALGCGSCPYLADAESKDQREEELAQGHALREREAQTFSI